MSRDTIAFGGFDVGVDFDGWPAKIVRALLRRHYEKHELRLVSRLLKPRDRIIELGSAIGIVSLAASRIVPPEQIFCFDANPEMVEEARQNYQRNGKAVTVENAVLSAGADAGSTATFYRMPYFLSSSLEQRSADASPVDVPVLSLEAVIAEKKANVLIIDIEGGEFDLLGRVSLAGIDTLILEVHVSLAGVDACLGLIADLEEQGLGLDTDLTAHNVFVFKRKTGAHAPGAGQRPFAEAYLQALETSDAGDRAGALAFLQRACEACPQNAYAHLLKSQILFIGGDAENALEPAETAVGLDKNNEDAFEQLAVVQSALGNPDEAAEAYRTAISLVPTRPLFHAGLGSVLARQGRADEALDAFTAAADLVPDRQKTFDALIELAGQQDKHAGDNDGWDQRRNAPDASRPDVLNAVSSVLKRKFRFPDAAQALDHALKLAPQRDDLHAALGLLVARPADIREACRHLTTQAM